MTLDEISAIVEQQVQTAPEHRDAIKKCLVDPTTEKFDCIDSNDKPLWIVGKNEEYYITFDEVSGNFGLAFRNIMNMMVYLGDEGSLADAYSALIAPERPS